MDPELFDRVAALVARETGVRRERVRPETFVEDDLGCTGDDAAELMEAFARAFGVDRTGFVFDRHFGPEAPVTPWILLRGVAVWAATGRRGDPSPEPVSVARLVEAAARGGTGLGPTWRQPNEALQPTERGERNDFRLARAARPRHHCARAAALGG